MGMLLVAFYFYRLAVVNAKKKTTKERRVISMSRWREATKV
jgi:hypothetical protein